ncbi:10757_t:CDS:2 [Funneliformis mosseae]|uniref:10757_t:CDS:1 n=1 Tax=Funneliformis mosseae TaxID=27381 RepID=A0A9N9CCX7_FUNMO|nr:10757_t:CDS:2 [Funneliformis mosseae]
MHKNNCNTEKIERPIHNSFNNKAFLHDLFWDNKSNILFISLI